MTFTERHYPDRIGHEQLDKYLANGWFRMGQMIFTCWFLVFDYELFSAVWIRQDLRTHKFSKSLRKILKKNHAQFRVEIGPARFDAEKDRLYDSYKKRFEGYISETLKESLFDNMDHNIFDTYEVSVYDGDRLIAASFFDVGSNSLASILGLFHEDYSKHSLGLFTMLCEMEYGIEKGMHYYYPGYIVPGYDRFDYKLRIGEVDYFNFHQRAWLPFDSLKVEKLPVEELRSKLLSVKLVLDRLNLPNHLVLYPMYDREVFPFSRRDQINHPIFILCGYRDAPYLIEYNILDKVFTLSTFNELMDLDCFNRRINRQGKSVITCYFPLVKDKILATCSESEDMAQALIKELNF